MSQYPEGRIRDLTEVIMDAIRPHLKEEPPPLNNQHFNRTYEKIYESIERSDFQ